MFIAFYCGKNNNITSLEDCSLQTSIFENVLSNKSFIFSNDGNYVTALKNQIGKIEFILFAKNLSKVNYIEFRMIYNANIVILLNELIPTVSI